MQGSTQRPMECNEELGNTPAHYARFMAVLEHYGTEAGGQGFCVNGAGIIGYPHGKKMKLDPIFIIVQK